jgi:hypothetical protein
MNIILRLCCPENLTDNITDEAPLVENSVHYFEDIFKSSKYEDKE